MAAPPYSGHKHGPSGGRTQTSTLGRGGAMGGAVGGSVDVVMNRSVGGAMGGAVGGASTLPGNSTWERKQQVSSR